MIIHCDRCGAKREMPVGHVNRSRKGGFRLFCGRVCAGIARRKHKTKAQKVQEKAAYDAVYREKNLESLKKKKADHFRRTYDPVKAAVERKLNMPRHVEYCRRPEYRMKKREYDKHYRAAEYGEFAECYLLLQDIDREIDARADFYERAVQKGTVNKTLKRKREYEQSVSR